MTIRLPALLLALATALALALALVVAAGRAAGAPAHVAALPLAHDLSRDTLAWVGNRVVTAEDLVRRVELMPWQDPERGRGADTANVRALEALVGEKLLAQEAERQGLGASGHGAGMRRALARALSRDALYRREVAGDSTHADAVLARVLVGRRVSVDPATFKLLCDALRARMGATPENRAGHDGRIRILSEDADDLLARLAGNLGHTLVRLPGGALTLEDVIEDLRFYEFSVRSLAPDAFARDFNGHLKVVVERDLLAAEGERQHLDRLPDVRHEIETWTDAWQADALARSVAAAAPKTGVDGLRWLALHLPDRARDLCEVEVEEILAPNEEDAGALKAELRGGADFAALARAHSERKEWAARGGRSGYFAVAAHEEIGYTALLSPLDSLVGPLRVAGGFSVFRTLGKRVRPDSVASAGQLPARAEAAALAEARGRRVDQYVASLAARTRVRLEPRRAAALALAGPRMLTRRVLGFGGAMMAAPGLAPMWSWADAWRKAGAAVP